LCFVSSLEVNKLAWKYVTGQTRLGKENGWKREIMKCSPQTYTELDSGFICINRVG